MDENTNESGGFKKVPASEILAKIEKREPIECDHVIIEGDLDISKLNLPKNGERFIIAFTISIINSIIEGNANFTKVVFNEEINFSRSQFNGLACFKGSQFNRDTNFIETEFNEETNFEDSQFNKPTDFRGSKYNDIIIFEKSKFQDVYFSDSQFDGNAYFNRSQFVEYTSFWKSRFNSNAHFMESEFNGETNFRETEFNGETKFTYSKFNKPTHFNSSKFKGKTDFNESQFKGEADFRVVTFQLGADFIEATFGQDALFDGSNFGEKLSLVRTKYDRLYIRWKNFTKPRYQWKFLKNWCRVNNLVYEETAYLLLVENFKKLGFFEDADECYYTYRKNYQIEDPVRRLIDLAAWLFFGYGVKPARPLIWSALIIMLSGAFFKVYLSMSSGEAFFFSATAFTSGINPLLNSAIADFPHGGYPLYVVTVERLLGPVFFALFLASIAKTIIR